MAETAIRRELGLLDEWGSYPRRKVEAEFLQVLVFEDEIEVRIRPERLGQTSITWAFEITRTARSASAARSSSCTWTPRPTRAA